MQDINDTTGRIIDAAMKVHTALGPGLLESAYEGVLLYELRKCGLSVLNQVIRPILYDGIQIDVGYRLDLLVNDHVIVELKSVEKMIPLYDAQLITYLKLSGLKVGLLMNFNVPHMKDGIKRVIYDLDPSVALRGLRGKS
jgi:GxxExxY protein